MPVCESGLLITAKYSNSSGPCPNVSSEIFIDNNKWNVYLGETFIGEIDLNNKNAENDITDSLYVNSYDILDYINQFGCELKFEITCATQNCHGGVTWYEVTDNYGAVLYNNCVLNSFEVNCCSGIQPTTYESFNVNSTPVGSCEGGCPTVQQLLPAPAGNSTISISYNTTFSFIKGNSTGTVFFSEVIDQCVIPVGALSVDYEGGDGGSGNGISGSANLKPVAIGGGVCGFTIYGGVGGYFGATGTIGGTFSIDFIPTEEIVGSHSVTFDVVYYELSEIDENGNSIYSEIGRISATAVIIITIDSVPNTTTTTTTTTSLPTTVRCDASTKPPPSIDNPTDVELTTIPSTNSPRNIVLIDASLPLNSDTILTTTTSSTTTSTTTPKLILIPSTTTQPCDIDCNKLGY